MMFTIYGINLLGFVHATGVLWGLGLFPLATAGPRRRHPTGYARASLGPSRVSQSFKKSSSSFSSMAACLPRLVVQRWSPWPPLPGRLVSTSSESCNEFVDAVAIHSSCDERQVRRSHGELEEP